MNSSAKPGRVIRSARNDDDVFVMGTRREYAGDPTLATAGAVIAGADARAAALIVDAEAKAAIIVAEAQAQAAATRDAAYSDGLTIGRQQVEQQARAALDLIRHAAAEGQAIRDQVAEQAAGVVARAVSVALRRLVGDYYEADPGRTAAVCAEALRSAAGQEILSIRVFPELVESIQASLVDAARYIQPDETVEIGGCVIDLRNGTIDASVDARLSLMDLALREASGEGNE